MRKNQIAKTIALIVATALAQATFAQGDTTPTSSSTKLSSDTPRPATGEGPGVREIKATQEASGSKITFNIKAQPLEDALNEFARQTGYQVMFQSGMVEKQTAPPLNATLTPDAALRTLLSNTGLHYKFVNPRTVTISTTEQAVTTATGLHQTSLRLAQNTGTSNTGDTGNTGNTGEARNNGTEGPQNEDPSKAPTGAKESLEELSEVLVTGTHIRTTASSASPVHSFDQEDFAQAGATSVQQILRQLPQNFQGGATETSTVLGTSRNDGGGNLNLGAGVNLRGLGNSSTLVLLNGRRLTAGGLGAYVDVSTIPLNALERIDVVPDGSSAIYGSDAVGGVVNFVLRDDFTGIETNVRHGAVTDGNMRETAADTLFGTTWSGGAALVSLSYNDVDPLLAKDRDFASQFDEGGETYLTPDARTRAVLIDGHQDVGDALTLSATLYRTVREVNSANFRPASMFTPPTQTVTEGKSDAVGGTLSLDWRVANDWVLGVAQTLARNDTDRHNLSFDTSGNSIGLTQARAQHEISVTDLQIEGPIFSMPGGSARLAAGGEHRREAVEIVRGTTLTTGDERSRDVNAAYLEAFLPFINEANSTAWARRMDLTAAVRWEDYNDVGSTTNSKFGAVWSPVEGVALRASYGTSFRAPYLAQFDNTSAAGILYHPNFDFSQPVVAALLQTPHPDLGPEEATTWTAGLDLAPAAFGGVKLTATYFDIDYDERISAANLSLSPFTDPTLAPLLSQPLDASIIAEITRIQAENPASYLNVSSAASPADAQFTFDGRTRNQAKTRVSGVDFTLSKSFRTTQGTLDVGANASYLIKFENQTLAVAPVVDLADTLFNPIDLRVRGYASWSQGGWVLSAIVNYADEYKDNQLQPLIEKIASWTTVDLGAAYTFSTNRRLTDGVTLRFNAINVFDEDPPYITDLFLIPGSGFGSPGFDPENANPLGRMVSFQLSKRW